MNRVFHVAFAFVREHPVRLVLTSLSTVAAACMVVWVASGYDALLRSFDEYSDLALGRYALAVAPIDRSKDNEVPRKVLTALRDDPDVAAADAFWAQTMMVRRGDGTSQPNRDVGSSSVETATRKTREGRPFGDQSHRSGGGPMRGPGPRRPPISVVLGTDSTTPPFEMQSGRWIGTEAGDSNSQSGLRESAGHNQTLEAVIRGDTAERFAVAVGDTVRVGDGDQTSELRIVGIVNGPTMISGGGDASIEVITPGSGELFVTMSDAERIFSKPPAISLVGVAMKPEADINRFRFGWAPRLSRFSTPVQFQRAVDIEEALDETEGAKNVQIQAFASTGIAILVSLLVIFSTLSMGVTERVRQYAILRAVVFTRFEIGVLVAMEGIVLATIGFVGGLGIGQGLLWLSAGTSREVLRHGVSVGATSILLAAVATYGGALLASIVPIWTATRVRPVDAMAQRPHASNVHGLPRIATAIGVALILVNPVFTFVFPPGFSPRAIVTLAVGFTSMAIGFVLISPAVVVFVDRWISPLLARILGIDPRLLESQITNNIWRTVGTAISMAIGMGLYVGIFVWGFTMLEAFIPGSWAPDALIAAEKSGCPRKWSPPFVRSPVSIPIAANRSLSSSRDCWRTSPAAPNGLR